MLLVRRFRLLILLVFLLACTLHIMVDLLPRLERRAAVAGGEAAAGGASGVGGASAGCSCSHARPPGGEAQDWAKQQQQQPPKGASEAAAAAAAAAGWPSKHTLRILQDFSSEPSSNLSSRSAEKGAAAAAEPGGHKALIPDAGAAAGGGGPAGKQRRPSGGGGGGGLQQAQAGPQGSRLAALFQQPLYRLAAPPLGDQDVLFNVNSDIRFNPKAAENQDCGQKR
ncbi:UNVERIFIED_CONTAM: hypothetical protein K2H54_029027 [Gekko kuhli]